MPSFPLWYLAHVSGALQDGGGAAQAAIIVDHAEARHGAPRGVIHLLPERPAQQLAQGFHQPEETARRPGLAH